MTSSIKDWLAALLFLSLLFLFLGVDFTALASLHMSIAPDWRNMIVMFLSVFLEAMPFVIVGVFASACIQTFISEAQIKRLIPKFPVVGILPAACIGLIFPMCECVIIPVVRRLIQKGLPVHLGIVMIVSVPILNPIVFASTYYAFRSTPQMAYDRMVVAGISAILIGVAMYILYTERKDVLQPYEEQVEVTHVHGRFFTTMHHAADEFFEAGKYVVIGAFVASIFQTFLSRDVLTSFAANEFVSPFIMMVFAYILSLCSEADAFIAASLQHAFPAKPLLAFLVFGPMLDFKNTLMLFAYFKKKFAFVLIGVISIIVYLVSILYR
ncbi:permease [Ectobacillus sp. JY-23]|uniref:permease n=1 Tax=Ectobacillus sp. JY-23 TaxID=2933872 RepID=UPI001FF1EF01|nr:permease [Ectobacillus sp. JY-23]UOY92756.1 permease [Ectobacillus sp. JY-23]